MDQVLLLSLFTYEETVAQKGQGAFPGYAANSGRAKVQSQVHLTIQQ